MLDFFFEAGLGGTASPCYFPSLLCDTCRSVIAHSGGLQSFSTGLPSAHAPVMPARVRPTFKILKVKTTKAGGGLQEKNTPLYLEVWGKFS